MQSSITFLSLSSLIVILTLTGQIYADSSNGHIEDKDNVQYLNTVCSFLKEGSAYREQCENQYHKILRKEGHHETAAYGACLEMAQRRGSDMNNCFSRLTQKIDSKVNAKCSAQSNIAHRNCYNDFFRKKVEERKIKLGTRPPSWHKAESTSNEKAICDLAFFVPDEVIKANCIQTYRRNFTEFGSHESAALKSCLFLRENVSSTLGNTCLGEVSKLYHVVSGCDQLSDKEQIFSCLYYPLEKRLKDREDYLSYLAKEKLSVVADALARKCLDDLQKTGRAFRKMGERSEDINNNLNVSNCSSDKLQNKAMGKARSSILDDLIRSSKPDSSRSFNKLEAIPLGSGSASQK